MAIAEFHYGCNAITRFHSFNKNETPLPEHQRDHGIDHPGIHPMINHYYQTKNIKTESTKKPRRHIKRSLQATCPEQRAGRTTTTSSKLTNGFIPM